VELVIGQLNPQSDTEVYCLLVSNPAPVNVMVAPPAYEDVGLLDVGKLADTIKSYLETSLLYAYAPSS
jgi:hypothetical protein